MSRRVLAILATVSCTTSVVPPLTPAESDRIEWWLTCIECEAALDSIRAIGARNPTSTVDTLNRALVSGPLPAPVASVTALLNTAFTRESTWRANQGLVPPVDRVGWVGGELGRYVDGYRSRGAIGMGWIRTPEALANLDAALAGSLPAPLRAAVVYARDSLP